MFVQEILYIQASSGLLSKEDKSKLTEDMRTKCVVWWHTLESLRFDLVVVCWKFCLI